VDIHETADFLILKAELPGISAQDINIEIKDNTLVLQGERKSEAEVEEGQYHRTERMYGTFHRSFLLPTTIDQERAQANYKDGVLEVRLPKTATSQPKRITIGSYPP
jgi:HSP20 family protein